MDMLRLLSGVLRRAAGPPAPSAAQPDAPPGPLIANVARVFGLDRARSVHSTARLYVRERPPEMVGRIVFERDVYIGREVELLALDELSVGEDSSIQDHCVFHGDIRIGRHCLFASHILMTSTMHRFRDRPAWLIRDQDRLAQDTGMSTSRPIVVDDDCWLGWSVAVQPGVHIGRGAIIGSNCVVSRDVPPYEIHGGSPNVKIGERLVFSPPARVDAADDDAIPYLYRGFRTEQDRLAASRADGYVEADGPALVVLAGTSSPRVVLDLVPGGAEGSSVDVRVNGVDCGRYRLGGGVIEVAVDAGSQIEGCAPAILAGHTLIEIIPVHARAADNEPAFALRTARLT